ncbi:MAG: N-acetyltransferase [Oscillospiraceae bacterium]|nr:N-acetyltransferase [Oscillospiraceae bacterium]
MESRQTGVRIRPAVCADAERLAEIFAYYVLHTAVAFDYEPPSAETFRARIAQVTEAHPWLVAEADGRVLGYAYAGPFVGRAGYRFSRELTIYLDPAARGRGIGRALYAALETRLRALGVRNLYACIGDPAADDDPYLTRASERFHARMGFVRVGVFTKCGYKFERWYNMIWMEKRLEG